MGPKKVCEAGGEKSNSGLIMKQGNEVSVQQAAVMKVTRPFPLLHAKQGMAM